MSATADLSWQASSALPPSDGGHPSLRPIPFSDPEGPVDRRADGTIYLRPQRLDIEYPARLTDALRYWAAVAPDRLFMAERGADGGWPKVTYAELLSASRRVASSLLARDLSSERPVVILSGNSIDHALIAFGALVG